MAEINSIIKLEIKINEIERMADLVEKRGSQEIKGEHLATILKVVVEMMNEVRNKFVEVDIEKTETRKRIDALLELIEKMAEQRLNEKIQEIKDYEKK